jgi:uncharacterized membrane protein
MRAVVVLLLLFAVAFNLYHLYPEVTLQVPALNDRVLHTQAAEHLARSLAAGQDPTDAWLATISLGYPLFHHYQHLGYLPLAIAHRLSGGTLSLSRLFGWASFLLLGLFPLSVYWSARRFGFSGLTAALAGLVASLLATDGLYGFDLVSYTWRGYGMYTQLWGMVLLPLALAQTYVAVRTGRGYVWAVLLLSITTMSHLVCGYVALVSIPLFVLLPVIGQDAQPGAWRRGGRALLLLALVLLATAYFVVPFLLDSAYMNRSVWEIQEKYDSYGHERVFGDLVKGQMLDFGRFPSLTILAGVGLVVCLWRWRQEHYRFPVILAIFWLLLYFGRPTWGALLDLLPLSRSLHLHRLIIGVHLGSIYLAGLGLAFPWHWALSRGDVRYLIAATALIAAILYPVYKERGAYLRENTRLMIESQRALAAEQDEVAELLAALRRAPPGRVYAGLAANWGKEYTVGAIPVYALLNGAGLDTLGYLYHALSLNADVQVLFDERLAEHYDLFNVRYVVAPVDRALPEFVKPVQSFGRHRLYSVETSGYFDLVGSETSFVGDKADFYPAAHRWLLSDLPRAKQHPTLFLGRAADFGRRTFSLSQAEDVIPHIAPEPGIARGRIVSETVETNGYLARIEVQRDSLLMLKATYHPNWRAYVDGVATSTVMLMPSYVGVEVSPGVHLVRLAYRPRALRGYLSAVGLLTYPLIALATHKRERLSKWLQSARPGWLPRLVRWATAAIQAATSTVKKRVGVHLPYLGMLALVALLAGLPLFQLKILGGHDALAYLPRTVEFYEGLKARQLFPRWAPDLNFGYGEPTFNFNAPLIYYLSSSFHALGFSFVAAQSLACFALLCLAGLSMYLLAGEFFGPRGGLVSAVAYLLAPYLLAALYVRYALADYTAFASMPMAFWGLYRYATRGRFRDLFVGALAVCLLVLSSNSVSLIAFPALLLLPGWLFAAHRDWRALVRGLWCLALGLGLSAFFWLPALAERNFVHVYRRLEGYLDFHNHFVYLRQFFFSRWGYGLSLPGPEDGMSFAIGPVHLLLVGAALLFVRRVHRAQRRAGLLVSFFLALLLLSTFFASQASTFLWERLSLLHPLQFPWRFLSLVAVSTSFVCGFPFLLLPAGNERLANGLMAVLVAGLLLIGLPRARPASYLDVQDADYSPRNIAAQGIEATARQFEPIWVQELPSTPAAGPLTFIDGRGQLLGARMWPAYYELYVEIAEEARLRVNTFYFPGWTLYVNGAERAVTYDNPQGTMEFSLERGEHVVQVRFEDTPVRLWSTRASLLALVLLALTPYAGRIRRPIRPDSGTENEEPNSALACTR